MLHGHVESLSGGHPRASEDFGRRRGFPIQSQDHLCASEFWSRGIVSGAGAEISGGSERLDRGSRERPRPLAGIILRYSYRLKFTTRSLISGSNLLLTGMFARVLHS